MQQYKIVLTPQPVERRRRRLNWYKLAQRIFWCGAVWFIVYCLIWGPW